MVRLLRILLSLFIVLGIVLFFLGCGVLPPTITQISISPSNKVIVGTAVTISAEATSQSTTSLTYNWSATGGNLSSNSGRVVIWTAPSTPGTYKITLVVSDGTNSVSDSIEILVVNADTPIINSLVALPNPVVVGKTAKISCAATDPNSLPLSYVWSASGGTILSGSSEITWKAPQIAGIYVITVSVTNSKLSSASSSINVEAVDPQAPTITNLSASASSVDSGGTITLTCYASDPYGLDLTYSWSASASGGGATGTFSGNGSSVTWNAPTVTSTKDITITVTVSNGSLSSTKSIIVTVKSG